MTDEIALGPKEDGAGATAAPRSAPYPNLPHHGWRDSRLNRI